MSNEEAIEILDSFYECDEVYAASQTAIKALEKQAPKKPSGIKARHDFEGKVLYKYGYCNVCAEEVVSNNQYCHGCGQKLEW